MIYSEFYELCQKRRKTVGDISRHIGMTYQGLKTSLDNGKMAADKIEKLCRVLAITPNAFFGWEKVGQATYIDSNVQNGDHNIQFVSAAMETLKEQLAIKDRQILELISLLDRRK